MNLGIGLNQLGLGGVGAGGGADTTAPTLTGVAYTEPDADFSLDEAATVYYVIDAVNTKPSAAQVKAGLDNGGAAADLDGSFAASAGANSEAIDVSSLSAGTYYLFMMAEDASGNQSAVTDSVTIEIVVLSSPTTLFESSEIGFFWDTTDAGDLYQGSGLTTAVTADAQSVRSIADSSGNNNHAEADSGEEPTWSAADKALSFDGVNEGIGTASYTQNGTQMSFMCAIKTTDADGILVSAKDSNDAWFGIYSDGSTSTSLSGNSGTPTYYIDGTVFSGTNRDDMHTALCDGNWHLFEARGVVASTQWTGDLVMIGQYNNGASTFDVDGLIGSPVLISNVTAADLNDVRAWYAAHYGITLP